MRRRELFRRLAGIATGAAGAAVLPSVVLPATQVPLPAEPLHYASFEVTLDTRKLAEAVVDQMAKDITLDYRGAGAKLRRALAELP